MNTSVLSIFTAIFIFSSYTSSAQNARIYKTLSDFMDSRYISANISIETIEKENKEWVGANIYKISTGNKKMDALVKREYFAIEHHDSLFLNCRDRIEVSCYANVLLRGGNYLFFSTVPSKLPEHRQFISGKVSNQAISRSVGMSALGIASGAITGFGFFSIPKSEGPIKTKYCYIYDMQSNIVEVMTPQLMLEILEVRPALKNMYINGGNPDNESTYFYYLSKFFNLE